MDVGGWLLATRYWLLAAGCLLTSICYWLLAVGRWLLDVGCRCSFSLAAGCCLVADRCWLTGDGDDWVLDVAWEEWTPRDKRAIPEGGGTGREGVNGEGVGTLRSITTSSLRSSCIGW